MPALMLTPLSLTVQLDQPEPALVSRPRDYLRLTDDDGLGAHLIASGFLYSDAARDEDLDRSVWHGTTAHLRTRLHDVIICNTNGTNNEDPQYSE